MFYFLWKLKVDVLVQYICSSFTIFGCSAKLPYIVYDKNDNFGFVCLGWWLTNEFNSWGIFLILKPNTLNLHNIRISSKVDWLQRFTLQSYLQLAHRRKLAENEEWLRGKETSTFSLLWQLIIWNTSNSLLFK